MVHTPDGVAHHTNGNIDETDETGALPLPRETLSGYILAMAEEHAGRIRVDTGLIMQTLVENAFALMEKRRAERPPEDLVAVLEADQHLTDAGDPALDTDLRHAGYQARVVEAEMFEPARTPADWVQDMLSERFARTQSWRQAVAELSGELARSEPLERPSPDDEAAMSWRVPGPGGHVRHYLVRRTIEDRLLDREDPLPIDPAELKRPWMYGFFVRTCEEALPPEAELGE